MSKLCSPLSADARSIVEIELADQNYCRHNKS